MNTPSTPLDRDNDPTLRAPTLTPAILSALIAPGTIPELLDDLQDKRWESPRALFTHFGFNWRTGPAFTNGLYKFCRDGKFLSHTQWMECWV